MADVKSKRVLLGAITTLFWFAQYVYIPFLAPYLLSLSLKATVVGIVIGAYGFTQLVLRIPLGILIDVVKSHKFFISIGVFLAAISSIGMLIFPSPVLLFVANGLSGVASSTWISFTILYTTYYENSLSTKAIGLINAFQNIGILAAFVLGGTLFELFGIRALFILSFIFGMIGFLLSLAIRPEVSARGTNVNVVSLVKVMKDKRLLVFAILCSFTYLILFGTVFSFTTSTAKQLGATGLQLGILAILYSTATIISSYFVGTNVASKLGEKNTISLAFLLLAIYCVGISVSSSIIPFFPLQFICGFGSGMLTSSLMAYSVKHIDDDKKTTAMGFYQSIYCVGMTIGPVFMGILMDNTSKVLSFLVMAFIALVCSAFISVLYKASSTFREC